MREFTAEHRARISAALKGRSKSEAHRKALSESTMGRRKGPDNSHWKGGRYTRGDGYVFAYAPNHPNAIVKGTYVLEHRLVAEETLGRLLTEDEVVHHINGITSDNRPENLMVFPSHSEHVRYEAAQKKEQS